MQCTVKRAAHHADATPTRKRKRNTNPTAATSTPTTTTHATYWQNPYKAYMLMHFLASEFKHMHPWMLRFIHAATHTQVSSKPVRFPEPSIKSWNTIVALQSNPIAFWSAIHHIALQFSLRSIEAFTFSTSHPKLAKQNIRFRESVYWLGTLKRAQSHYSTAYPPIVLVNPAIGLTLPNRCSPYAFTWRCVVLRDACEWEKIQYPGNWMCAYHRCHHFIKVDVVCSHNTITARKTSSLMHIQSSICQANMFRFIAQSSIWFWCALMLWKRHVEQQQQQRQQQQRRQQQQQQQQQKSKVVLDLVNNKSASCHAQVPPTPTTPPAPTWINAWRAGASLLNSKTIGLDIPNNVEVHSVRLESGKAWAIYDRTNVVDEQQKRTSWCMSYLSSRNHKTLSDNDITSAASHDKSSLMDTWLARHVAHAKQSPGLFQYGNTMAQIYSAYDKAEIPPAWANLLPPVFR